MGKVVERQNGKRAVTIKKDEYGIELMTMRNGFQWTGMTVDAEVLAMLLDALNEFVSPPPNAENHMGNNGVHAAHCCVLHGCKYGDSDIATPESMEIQLLMDGVDGSFDMGQGKLVCVPMPKHAQVLLCFEGQMNIPFAEIKLHSADRYSDAMKVLADATALGKEIAQRWNERESQCPTIHGCESIALLRDLKECAALLGLGVSADSADVVDALRNRLQLSKE